ncbi:ABC transporter ATP-binding protein [Mycoplasmopsis columboralis]|uniref:ABC transporter ATP-binding protein n=1 Tax=Mycoplasmopsis columboralis TaxID=171282 RepID=A0A449B6T9_9BACT|nr:ABC transporter ATP-binding protein [Mycoplasmopsis columboralis]VEU76320.1 ABC transporter ATP-binding protein [Mycoplasmopsis columboralis]
MEQNTKNTILKINKLTKSFGKYKALNELSFSVQKGELFGFLGVNGAGKTTTLNIILGLLKYDSGEVLINDKNISHYGEYIRNEIGVVFQESILDPYLSPKEILYQKATLYLKDSKQQIKQKVSEIIQLFNLQDFQDKMYKTLSGGQKRRVDIARALVHSPSILFLDEPTTGLDPNSRKLVWKILNQYRKEKDLTIILTTHYMEEAANCNNVIVLDKGVIVAEGTVADLKNKFTNSTLKIYSRKNKALEEYILNTGKEFEFENNCYLINFKNTKQIKDYILEHPEMMSDIEIIKGDMDDVFLSITKN